ncbi:hypothetical protein OOZ19_00730 [Saccharopolyspora sp. NFXS83]|uniref:hypothetical protein n=1 Tax=Saccharopolyspora sp. NFXS83 TaxID=2993560 RepID=UPI00224B4A7C|nr:hypothetical protein [Saccharopolyspora sp. NFXS83]MCX2728755.1 hypothetical protein [Saccharopolyspora sp. NFXS83]
MWPFRKNTDQDAGKTRRVERLGARIAESKRLRPLSLDPDLIAVAMERTRRRTVAGLWFFLALGLSFTTTGVQAFLAGDATSGDPVWWAAWTVEPMFAGLLILLLNFEAVILSHGVEPGHHWWTRIKRVLLGTTLFMNVIPQLDPTRFQLGSLAVHLIIPVVVYGLAEVIPVIQARSRQVVMQGYADAAGHDSPAETREVVPQPAPAPTAPEAPTPMPPVVPAEPVKRGPRLPSHVVDALKRARDQAAEEGRGFAPADVQQVVKVPDAMATAIHADLIAT